jgi:competence protein ComEC
MVAMGIKWRRWLVVAALGVMAGWIWFQPDDKLHVTVCDVGQGDGILVVKGQTQVVIDGGKSDRFISCLSEYMPFWDRQIELMVLTNGDADHVTGLIEVLQRYNVKRVMANNLYQDTEVFEVFRAAVEYEDVEVYGPEKGDRIVLGSPDWLLEVLWPEKELGDELVWSDDRVLGANTYDERKANEQSVVLELRYGEFEVLLTGDIGEETEERLLGAELVSEVEILKVGHHGSRYSSSDAFLSKVKPEVAVISTGKNSYGHPTQEAMDRLEAVGAKVLRTDRDGDVEIVTDGKSYWVN